MAHSLLKRLEQKIDTKIADITMTGFVTKEPVPFEERLSYECKPLNIGDTWGSLFDCAWFKLSGKVPQNTTENIYLKLDLNAEALLFNKQGNPVIGFTSKSSAFGFLNLLGSPQKRYCKINELLEEDGSFELWLDVGLNDLFGNLKRDGKIEIAEIVSRNKDYQDLFFDVKTLEELKRKSYKRDKAHYKKYVTALNSIKKTLKIMNVQTVSQAKEIAKAAFNNTEHPDHYISSVGHAHLDLAWLWPLRETKRKGARTFANMLRLMEQYDDFIFGASQPQLYQWIQQEHPALFEEIKQRVKEGRWEVQGGMWVESDTNVTGEESLVRQMLYGIRYFQQEFGVRVKNLWLPDVFGYSGNLPQIIKKSGLDYFMTIKISWNDTNKFPYHTFNWTGIDGSTVFTHMPPEGQYNSPANVTHLLKSKENYREKHIDNQTLNLFGVGDGGGGPSDYHIEHIHRLNNSYPISSVKMETASDFFAKLVQKRDKFPTYQGELYLEKHRGTYTSQGNVKYYNRLLEQKLKTTETLLVQINQYSTYKIQLEQIWKEVLLYQFHDILPGSSIKRVYDECLARYAILDKQIEDILTAISHNTRDTYYNPLLSKATVRQIESDTLHQYRINPMSTKVIDYKSYAKEKMTWRDVFENKHFIVTFNRNGWIKSIRRKQDNKELLSGLGNKLTVYKDIANAWDIFKYYKYLPKATPKLQSKEAYKYGETIELVFHYTYKKSSITQHVYLYEDTQLIDFHLDVDWQSNKRMLRTSFPLNLRTDKGVYDIQFGHIERSTKNKSKIEKAQYEMCGQQWMDMSDSNWGASLITDSKYGFKGKGNTLDLHLIKSTNTPAKQGDIGKHRIKYALHLHEGDHIDARVDDIALEYNTYYPKINSNLLFESKFHIDNPSIAYSTIKQAEDSDDVIIRLYEKDGKKQVCTFELEQKVTLFETNMVEENPIKIGEGNCFKLDFTPFMVRTFKIKKMILETGEL